MIGPVSGPGNGGNFNFVENMITGRINKITTTRRSAIPLARRENAIYFY